MTIEIENLKIYAFHGVLPQERTVGNMYQIDCIISTDFSRAMLTDCLDDTLSYADAVEVIQTEMKTSSNLLEHVGGRICKALRSRFGNRIENIDLRIAKLAPPIDADIKTCAIHIQD